jgi:pimeloyl-ACP methyl ester carboxylesterase
LIETLQNQAFVDPLFDVMSRTSENAILGALRAVSNWKLDHVIANVGHTLVIRGTQDTRVREHDANDLALALRTQLTQIHGGHLLYVEQPDLFASLLLAS